MNSKALQLAISTIVIFIISIAVLIGIVIFLTGGFQNLRSSTQPFLDSSEPASIRQACQLACDQHSRFTYCCTEHEFDDQIIKCTDQRLETSCTLTCDDFQCEEQ